MGESILNLAKTLQALFGQLGEDVKRGLRSLGYSDAELEPFLTVMELRDALDSGHVMLSVMNEEQAHELYVFLYAREAPFRELLNRAVEGTRKGTFTVQEHSDLTFARAPSRYRRKQFPLRYTDLLPDFAPVRK